MNTSSAPIDPRRLAALNALGLPCAWVRRDALEPAALAALVPALPGAPAPRAAAAPRARRPEPRAAAPAATPVAAAVPVAAAAPLPPPAQLRSASPGRIQAIGELDLPALAEFTQACRACPLGGQRHQAVFGVGDIRTQLMLVGEAPGAEEDRVGQPFVGAAGKLLDNMLGAIGRSRASDDPARSVYIANVIKCRPPGNRNPEPDEIAQCQPILERQIERVRPRVLLAVGRFAAQVLTGSNEPISRLRQRAFAYRGIPVVVTYHPAYLLRSPSEKAKAWADLCLLQDTLHSGTGN